MTNILAKSNTNREQNSLPAHPEDTLWGVLGKEEASSLLRCAPDYCGHLLSIRRDHQQLGHDRADRQMGPRTYGIWHHLCATHVYKIRGLGGFYHRMDRSTCRTGHSRPGVLEHVLRWLFDAARSGSRSCLGLPQWEPNEVCTLFKFQG